MCVLQFVCDKEGVSYLVWHINETLEELLNKHKSKFRDIDKLLKLSDDKIMGLLSEASALETLLSYHRINHSDIVFNEDLTLETQDVNWNISTSSCPEFAVAIIDFERKVNINISLYKDLKWLKNLMFNKHENFLLNESIKVDSLYYSVKKIAYSSYKNQICNIKNDVILEDEYISSNSTIKGFVGGIPFRVHGIMQEYFLITYLRKLERVDELEIKDI